MKKFFFLLLLLFTPVFAQASIVGHWFYYEKIYRGQLMPEPPESTLRLHFRFSATGESQLTWWHEGSPEFCERKGSYSVENNLLIDTVIWLNPANSHECSADPDMQLGRVTKTPISFEGPDLFLHLHIGDDPLIYVWKRLDPEDR